MGGIFYRSLPAVLFVLISAFTFGQELQNSNWHFSDGIGLQLEVSGPSIAASNIDVIPGVTPASISDTDGNLLFYTNGQQVWNANGDVIDNGVFSNLGLNNLFVPRPGNADQYYLFRSSEWGVDYSIVDVSLDGGAGGIVADEKEIAFHNHMSELMAAHKDESVNFWLILADNNSGGTTINLRIYEMDGTSIDPVNEYNYGYIWAGYYSSIDDARLAPDCSKIALLHKGHWLSFYLFDNTDGTITGDFPNALDTQTSFVSRCNLEFSPNGNFVYVIGDFFKIDRFSLEDWNLASIGLSKTTIAQADGFTTTWRDIKLGPFGNVYLINELDGTLDQIINPDVDEPETGVEPTGLELAVSGSYFLPNTPNLSCVPFSPPSFFYGDVCLGDTTYLSFSFGAEVDEIVWDFGSDEAVAGPIDEVATWVIYPEQGTYTITVELFYFETWHTHEFTVNVGEEPNLELGEDILLCDGELVELAVPNEELYEIEWSTGSTEPSIEVATSGTYAVTINNLGCMVSDSVAVDVIPQIPTLLEDIGQCDQDEPLTLNAENGAADTYQWSTGEDSPTIEVETTGTYWVAMSNACFTVIDTAEVILVEFPESLLPEELAICEGEEAVLTSEYTQGDILWNTGDEGPSITVTEPGQYSVTIDHANCTAQDTIGLSVTPAVAVELEDYVFCEEGFAVLDATDPNATEYNWSTGSNEPQITVEEGGTYWVEVSNACFSESDTSFIEVVVFPDPLLPGGLSACLGDTVTLTSTFSEGNITWTTGSDSTAIQVTESGTYGVFIEYMGCVASDEVFVDFQDFYPLDELELPNVFTPNGDGLNREFRLYLPEDPNVVLCNNQWLEANMTIFNRWGSRIHEDICSWNGNNSSGDAMSDGTYFYLVDLKSVCAGDSNTKRISGYVTLLR